MLMASVALTVACESTPVTVSITAPADTIYVRGDAVTFQMLVAGAENAAVELVKDDVVLVSLKAPYTYVWDAAQIPEGSYAFKARVKVRDATVESDVRTVVIDRTPPTIANRTPGLGVPEWKVSDGLSLVFSEALDSSTVTDARVTVIAADLPVPSSVALQEDKKTVNIVVPPGQMVTPSAVKVLIAPGIKDLAGNPLQPADESAPWTFVATPGWQRFGQPLPVAMPSADMPGVMDLAVGTDGFPRVALAVADGGIALQAWNGKAWQQQPTLAKAPQEKFQNLRLPALSLDDKNVPYFAYVVDEPKDFNIPRKALLSRLVNGVWQQVGTQPANDRAIGNLQPEVKVARDGTVLVHYRGNDEAEPDRERENGVRIWTGSKWFPESTQRIDMVAGTIYYGEGSVVTGRNAKPLVATCNTKRYRNVDVQWWAERGWQDRIQPPSIGPKGDASSQEYCRASIATDARNRILVGYVTANGLKQSLELQRIAIEGMAWEQIGGSVTLPDGQPGVPIRPAMAVDVRNSVSILVRTLAKGTSEFLLLRHSDVADAPWTIVALPELAAVGVHEPKLGLTPDGFPVAAVVVSDGTSAFVETLVWPSSRL
jgi:Bacterial Ig-like domain